MIQKRIFESVLQNSQEKINVDIKLGLEQNALLRIKFKALKCALSISTAGLNSVELHLVHHTMAVTQRHLCSPSYTEMRLICPETVVVATNEVNAIQSQFCDFIFVGWIRGLVN